LLISLWLLYVFLFLLIGWSVIEFSRKKITGYLVVAFLSVPLLMLSACDLPSGYLYDDVVYSSSANEKLVAVDQSGESDITGSYKIDREPISNLHEYGDGSADENKYDYRDYQPYSSVNEMGPASRVQNVNEDLLSVAASDLLSQIISGFGRMEEPVYPVPANDYGAFTASLDVAVRNALSGQNIEISPEPGVGPFILWYGVLDRYEESSNSAVLSFVLTNAESILFEATGTYLIGDNDEEAPAYRGADQKSELEASSSDLYINNQNTGRAMPRDNFYRGLVNENGPGMPVPLFSDQ
jgi:hypothetical protein